MKTMQSILMATDFGPSSAAMSRAVLRLAGIFGSRVTVLHVIDPLPMTRDAALILRDRATDHLRAVRQELTQEGVSVPDASVVMGAIGEAILDKAELIGADLIVLGAGERSPSRPFSVGPNAESVLQHARQPVLAVREDPPELALETILCPVDHSDPARRGLENAIRLAQASGGRLIVLSVLPEASWLRAAVETGKLAGAAEEFEQTWRGEFEEMLATTDFGSVSWESELRTGRAHEEIERGAREHGADLLVMGSTGRTGLARVLLGSVTRRMLRQLPCSILVVKGEDLLDSLFEDDLRTIRRHMEEGRELLDAGSVLESLAQFRLVLARHPYHVTALDCQAEAYERLGRTELAARSRRRAAAIRQHGS